MFGPDRLPDEFVVRFRIEADDPGRAELERRRTEIARGAQQGGKQFLAGFRANGVGAKGRDSRSPNRNDMLHPAQEGNDSVRRKPRLFRVDFVQDGVPTGREKLSRAVASISVGAEVSPADLFFCVHLPHFAIFFASLTPSQAPYHLPLPGAFEMLSRLMKRAVAW